jgi:hypothetical protein
VTVFAGGSDDRAATLRDEDRAAAAVLGIAEVVHLPLAGGRADAHAPPTPPPRSARSSTAPCPTASSRPAPPAGTSTTSPPSPRCACSTIPRRSSASATCRPPRASPGPPPLPDERPIPVGALLPRKLDGAGAYATLAAERFGGVPGLHAALTAYAEAEGRRLGADGPGEALVEPRRDTRKRRPGQDEEDKAALVRALRGGIGLTR